MVTKNIKYGHSVKEKTHSTVRNSYELVIIFAVFLRTLSNVYVIETAAGGKNVNGPTN